MPGLSGGEINLCKTSLSHNHDMARDGFEEMLARAGEVQEAALEAILLRNSGTEYLQSYISACDYPIDIASFKRCIPIVSHAHLFPFLKRIADGDTSPIFTTDPVNALSLSSGTTSDGQQKFLILYKEILQASLELFKIGAAYRARDFPIKAEGKVLELIFCGTLSITKGGVVTGTSTTHLFRSDEFKLKQNLTNVSPCSPPEVMQGCDSFQTMYCHLLCGLLCWEEIQFISSTFAYTLVEALRSFERHWKSLCEDIRHGHLNDWISDPLLRDIMCSNVLLHANPNLADLIAHKCIVAMEVGWYGIIPQLWPNCKYLLSIMTGAMEPYAKKLKHYAREVPLVCGDYGSTETWIGVNINPKADPTNVSFTVVPSFAYFEFLPISNSRSTSYIKSIHDSSATELTTNDKLLSLTEVEVGKEYEIVITTYGGLYRYRLGDVVRVTGFFKSSPQLAYVCRMGVELCINIDKNTEKDVQIVVEKASKMLGDLELIHFTSYADMSSTPGHYVIFWELNMKKLIEKDYKTLKECAKEMDMAFLDAGYVSSRHVHTIGPLELCIVCPGTFQTLLNRYLARGIAIAQYKNPHCVKSVEVIKILRQSVIISIFSSAYND